MKEIIILSATFISLFIATAFGQTTIKAEVDKASLTTDDSVTYKLIITSSEKNIPSPQLPKFTGFDAVSSAQSSTTSFVKGSIKTSIAYAFILTPMDIGKFKIEPSTIKIKNETFSTTAFEIEVKPARVRPKTKSEQKPPLPEEIQPESEQSSQITL